MDATELLRWVRAQWDRVAAGVAVVAGGLMLLIGWLGVSGSAYPAGQIPYLVSGGLGGLFMLGLGALLWFSADLRDEWRKLDRIEDEIRALRSSTQELAQVRTDVRRARRSRSSATVDN